MLKIIVTLGGIQIVAILAGMMRAKILAVLLGPSGVGVLSVVDQMVQLVTYASAFSLPFASVKFLSRAHSQGHARFRAMYAGLLRLLVTLTVVGAVIGLAVAIFEPRLLGSQLAEYRFFLIPAFIGIPCASLHAFFSSTLAAAQRARTSALVAVIAAVCLMLSALVGVSLAGIAGLYWSNLIVVVLIAVGFATYLWRTLDLPAFGRQGSVRQALRDNPDVIGFSLILYLTSFASSGALLVVRYALLRNFGEAQTGLLQSAISVSAALILVLSPTNGLFLTPILNRDIPKAEKLRAALEYQAKLVPVLGALAAPIVLFPQLVLTVLYSPAFAQVGPLLFLFVVAQVIALLGGVYQAVLIGFDDLKVYGAATALGSVVIGVGAWLLAPGHGIPGIAMGFLAGNVVTFGILFIWLTKTHRMVASYRLSLSMAYVVVALVLAGFLLGRLDAWQPLVMLLKVSLYGAFLVSLALLTSREELRRLLDQGRVLLASGVDR